MSKRKSIYFNAFIIETPDGKKVEILPINAYPVSIRQFPDKQIEAWYQQFINKIPEMDACKEFIDAKLKPSQFLKLLKTKGYKVYWK